MTTLSELRKANLAEQRSAPPSVLTEVRDSVSTEALTEASKSAGTDASTDLSTQASAGVLTDGRTQAPTDLPTDASASVGPDVSTAAGTGASKPARPSVPADAGAARTARRAGRAPAAAAPGGADPFLDRVREALARKTIHPGGVKATVEMPADLSQRAKRYCLDHAGVPVRQVFLELMAAFLDEEGY